MTVTAVAAVMVMTVVFVATRVACHITGEY
jgi:hypothetical protein